MARARRQHQGSDREPRPGVAAPPAGLAGGLTFVVRLVRDAGGHVTGIVERVRTGEKERVQRIAAISRVIARMLARGGPAVAGPARGRGRP
jgi:hypothetical protein